jgi:hypothetical protein
MADASERKRAVSFTAIGDDAHAHSSHGAALTIAQSAVAAHVRSKRVRAIVTA